MLSIVFSLMLIYEDSRKNSIFTFLTLDIINKIFNAEKDDENIHLKDTRDYFNNLNSNVKKDDELFNIKEVENLSKSDNLGVYSRIIKDDRIELKTLYDSI